MDFCFPLSEDMGVDADICLTTVQIQLLLFFFDNLLQILVIFLINEQNAFAYSFLNFSVPIKHFRLNYTVFL